MEVGSLTPCKNGDEGHQPLSKRCCTSTDVSVLQRCYLRAIQPDATLPCISKRKQEEEYDANRCPLDVFMSRANSDKGREDCDQNRHGDGAVE